MVQLVTSLTVDASLLRKLLALWDAGGDPRNPFQAVLVTPLFSSPSTLRLIREELKDKRGAKVYFDSGGYYAQQGKIPFDQLYCKLRDYYRAPENQWADWYVLPDHVPTSKDTPDIVEVKVYDTVTASKNLLAELPSSVQEQAIPVIQGHTEAQLRFCIQNYVARGMRYIGFGSFDTCGPNQSINRITAQSMNALALINESAVQQGFKLHLFGIGSPPAQYLFSRLQVRSFDSVTWLKAAGFGHVFLPFVRGYRITCRTTERTYISQEEFLFLKQQTEHSCPFCEQFRTLAESRPHRILHNLVVFAETVERLAYWSDVRITRVINQTSPSYTQMLNRENGRLHVSRFA